MHVNLSCGVDRVGRFFGLLVILLSLVASGADTKFIHLRNELIATRSPDRGKIQPQAARPAVSGLFIIQFDERVQPAWREQFRNLGVELLHYIPEDAFVARLEQTRVDAVKDLPFVRWVGEYRAEHKIHPAVQRILRGRNARPSSGISVLLSPAATPQELAGAHGSLLRLARASRMRFGTVLQGDVNAAQLTALAESPAVLWIEPAPRIKLFDEIASKIMGGEGGGHATVTQELGFDGRGVTVAVADSGLDTGDTNTMHPDLLGRVSALIYYGALTDAADEHSHGTHVAGIIAGNGATGETDEIGALYGLGVAPGARIVAQRIFDGDGNYMFDQPFSKLTDDAVTAGAVIGSNSWGDDTQGRYDLSAMEFDALVRDANGLAPGAPPYILEFSAGNAGPGPQSIGSPAVAKNVIATGAAQNNRFDLPLPEFPIYDTGQEAMADFSSRGPCEDGRIKPDVVAPGTWIASLRSEFANDDFAWWPISDNYMYQGGTSQAGPHVSGAAAVFVQYYRQTQTNATPSPALVKAALINCAVDMDDSVETGPVPNMDEGWGRVDLTRIIGSARQHEFVDQTALLGTGQTSERRVLVDNPDEPLKITLVYTDVPGFPGAIPALVNDLDLEVVGPDGTIYRGNQFEFGESVPNAPSADRINNVEAVLLFAPLPGEYVVRVRARNVVQDARVDTGAVDQDFALVVSGSLAPPGTGIVAFDRRVYTAPAVIQLKLFDQSLAGQPSVSLLLRSTNEAAGETITLMADGATGVFTASVATVTGPALADGRLQISHGDTIEAIYLDANPPATRRFTARADLVAPVITNVSATFRFGREIITWTTDEDTSALVLYGTNTLNLSVTNRFFNSAHEIVLTNVVPNLTYRFAVVAEDSAGNRSTNDNGGTNFTFTPIQAPSVLIVDAYNNDLFTVPPLAGYTQPLTQLGVSYEVWDTEVDGPVTANLLPPYRCVIWRVAEFSLGTTWSATDAQALTAYLAGGGSLLMASMEFLSRLEEAGFPNFARDVLQVQSFTPDTGVPAITGAPGDPIGSGINMTLDYTVYEDDFKDILGITADASDTITATTNASPVLMNGSSVAGVRSPKTGVDRPGRVVFLSFPLDAVPSGTGIGNNRAGLLRNILNFLAPQAGSSTVVLDKDVYSVPSLVTIEVEDLDLVGQGLAIVRCFSPRETNGVVVTMAETARGGLFRGTIPLALTNRPAAGPELKVQSGDAIRVEYLDLSAGQTMIATADVETNAPVISNVMVEPGYVDAVVTWQTSEPADALVQFSDSPGNFPINFTAYDPNFDLVHDLALERLKPQGTYYFRVVSRDRAGNVAVDDNQGRLYTFTTLTPLSPPWADNLENGSSDWAVITADESEIEWTLGVPSNGAAAYSPTQAWGSDLDGRDASLAESFLISPAILLSGGNRATLRFKQNYNFLPQSDFDIAEYGEVMLITNTATSPITLGAVADASSGWEDAEFDLSPYHDQVVYVVWHYVLLSFESWPRFGWLVDDVSVTVSNVVPGTMIISNNLAQARFTLTGPMNRTGQGISTVFTNAPPGQYAITFGTVLFYQTPAPQTNTLVATGTVLFEGNYTFADANTNGISDAWETNFFGALSSSRTASTDTDGDGMTDYAEFIAGSNPTNAASALALEVPLSPTNGQVQLTWPTISGHAYRLEMSINAATWTPVTDWTLANGAASSYTLTAPASGVAYLFRLAVRP